jgi:uncharacterized membrane protein (UPF0127 family)
MNLSSATGFLEATSEGRVVVPRIRVAETFLLRGIGLMGKRKVPEAYGAGLFFPNCRSLHTCFMRFPLDILFLDAAGQPLEVKSEVRPWSVVKGPKGSVHCLEMSRSSNWNSMGSPWIWRQV